MQGLIKVPRQGGRINKQSFAGPARGSLRASGLCCWRHRDAVGVRERDFFRRRANPSAAFGQLAGFVVEYARCNSLERSARRVSTGEEWLGYGNAALLGYSG